MSYNGSGTFVINSTGQPVVTGTVISSTAFNALTTDLATGLSTAITKDGQTTTTARVPFAQGISSTLVTDATSATTGSIITAGGISCQKALWVGTTSRLVGNTQHDGLVGIGMTPSNVLDITQSSTGSATAKLLNSNAGTAATSDLQVSNGTNFSVLRHNGASYTTNNIFRQDGCIITCTGAGGTTVATSAAQPIYFGINNAEKMRLDASGNLLVGQTSGNPNATGIALYPTQGIIVAQSSGQWSTLNTISGSGTEFLLKFRFSGTDVGSVSTTSTATAFNTSSDYRLKENVQPMTGGLATVAALKPVNYDWIIDKSAGEGFIAHELQAVIPGAVVGEKDALNEDGSIKPQGVDFSKIVPHLVAAIQELTTRLAALETK